MKRVAFVTALLLAAAPSAFAESIGEKTGVNSVLGIAPTTQDFVQQAAVSDMFEIQSSQAAVEMAGDDKTKDFAKQMIDGHGKTTSELKSLVSDKGVKATIPTEMDSTHADMLSKLKGYKGDDFTKEYGEDQVSAHKDAVSLFERYAQGGEDAALKEWAGKTLPELKHHLEMAQGLPQ